MLVAPREVLVCCVLPWSFPARVSCPMLRIMLTNLTTIHPNPKTQTRTKTATDSTAARTAASPESTAPRGRLYRYCTVPGTVPVCCSVTCFEILYTGSGSWALSMCDMLINPDLEATPLRFSSLLFTVLHPTTGRTEQRCTQ